MPAHNSGAFEQGRLEGKVEAMEGDIRMVKEDQRRIFEKLDEIGDRQASMLTTLTSNTKKIDTFIEQCGRCQTDNIDMRQRIALLERETSTDNIKRKAGTDKSPALEIRADENNIFRLAGEGFKKAFTSLVQYGVLFALFGGMLWMLGAFE